MLKKILLPLDGSPLAEYALPVAAQIASSSGSSIHLLQVVSPLVDYGGGLGLSPIPLLTTQMVETDMTRATDYLTGVAALQMFAGIQTKTEIKVGSPAQHILDFAVSEEVDLIVLCSHGRTGFTRWAMGSVARKLANQADIPVLVLRESEAPTLLPQINGARPISALVPLDGSSPAKEALLPASQLVAAVAARNQRVLHLVLVVPTAVGEGAGEEVQEEIRLAKAYLTQVKESLQTKLRDPGLSITWSVARDKDVASALLDIAEQGGRSAGSAGGEGCDVIVISTHGRNALERWVMGSVTERLLNTTRLPIMIV